MTSHAPKTTEPTPPDRREDSPDDLGLGRVVYDSPADPRVAQSGGEDCAVTEASEESFPASDPPAYTKTAPSPGSPDNGADAQP